MTIRRCIVLDWTTDEQIEAIGRLLDKECKKIYPLFNADQDKGFDNPEHVPDKELELLGSGLTNLCCDLGVDGYEMS